MENIFQLLRKPRYTFILLSGFCMLLLLLRIFSTHHFRYIFLAWNLFLAALPVFFAIAFLRSSSRIGRLCYAFAWFFFLPNAPYILTDYIHLAPNADAPFWFDWLLLTSFAWTGFLLGCWSVSLIWSRLRVIISKKFHGWFFLILVLSTAFGVYLGRFGRWNSWDVLVNPLDLFVSAMQALTEPRVLAMTVLFSVFLILAWSSLRSVVMMKLHE